MNCYARNLINTSFLCFSSLLIFSQVKDNRDSTISAKIGELKAVWNLDNDISREDKKYESYSKIPSLYKFNSSDTISEAQYLINVNEAKRKILKQDIGLYAAGNYLQNFNPAFNTDDNLLYHFRYQVGLDWNVLNDGFLSNRYKQQILKNQNTILKLTPKTKQNDGEEYVAISHKIIYSFNCHKIKILEKRQQLMDDKMSVANDLYLLKHLSRVNLIEIMQQAVDIGSMNQIYKSYNDELKLKMNVDSLPKNILPLFDVDFSKIIAHDSINPISDSILKLEIENVKLAHKPWTDIKLNTQVRFNYYDLVNSIYSRNYMSAGVGLEVPLPLRIKSNKKEVIAESKLLAFQQKEATKTVATDLLNSFYEFRYKLKQYNNFYEKRKNYEELIRVERVKDKFGDLEFNPLTALNLLDEMLQVDIEMLDIQQQMYLQLLDIHSKAPDLDIAGLIKPYKIDTVAMSSEKSNRSMYIWSDAQTKYEQSYIVEYLRLNKISTAILSLRKDKSNLTQANSLIGRFNAKGIKVELLIGSNKLLNAKNPNEYYDSLTSGLDLKMISAIHLDVEPHTMSDWASNKEEYLKQYVDLLKTTKQYFSKNGLQLSVSIPVFYPEDVLKDIYTQADKVYIMAYEHNDSEYIVRKVKEEFAIDASKTTVALRAKDFKNREECEKLISELSELLNTNNFAMHDFETFVKLDEISVNQNQK